MATAASAAPAARNDPRAVRMAIIAFLQYNLTLACIWGSFSVLLSAVETRLGVGRQLSTLAVPVLNLATAGLAAVVGALATRTSMRLVMVVGAAFAVAGFALLALTRSYALYLVAYGALIGPAMAVAVVMAPTLVTRWHRVNRGRTLGLVTTPVAVAVLPLLSNWMLQAHGVAATYAMLAGLAVVPLLAALFVAEPPAEAQSAPAQAAHGHAPATGAASPAGAGVAQIARAPQFWAFAAAFMTSAAGAIVLTAHMVPMARAWGYSATLAATLLSAQSFAGMAGTVVFGWIADRLGSARAFGLLVFDTAVLWCLLLLPLPFPLALALVAAIGVHGAGAVPVMSAALSEAFGAESFSRAYGLANLVNLPVSVVCVPAAAWAYARTGSYAAVIVTVAAMSLLAALFVLTAGGARRPAAVSQAAERGAA
jgi:MFS family permease